MTQLNVPQTRKAAKPLADGEKLAPLHRFIRLQADQSSAVNAETRTVTFPFSSETPVERWYGDEILSHATGAPNFDRLNNRAPLLFNHNMDDVIGVVEKAWVQDSRGYCTVRFARTPRGDEIMGMVTDGILSNVSFMYVVSRYVAEIDADGAEDDVYTATDWEAYEVSIVTIPADNSVGIGRSYADEDKQAVHVVRKTDSSTKPAAPAAITTNEDDMYRTKHIIRNAAAGVAGVASAASGAGNIPPQPDANQQRQWTQDSPLSSVDAAQIKRDAEASAVQRVEGIYALARKHNMPKDWVDDCIKNNVSIEAARGLVLDYMTASGQKPVADLGGTRVDMTDKEARGYSVLRAVHAIVTDSWDKAGFEREVSRTIAQQMQRDPRKSSFFLPSNLPFAPTSEHARAYFDQLPAHKRQQLQQRAIYQVGTAVQGGNLVETNLMQENFVQMLRNQAVVAQLGARFLTGLTGNVDIPRQTAASTAYWVAESGALTESEGAFDKISLRPKTIGALSKMSRLMLLQSSPAIEMLARQDLLQVLALGVDLAALSGSGTSNQPTGVVNQSGVASIVGGTNGAAASFDQLIQLYSAPLIANAPTDALGFAMNYKVRGYLATLKSSTGQYLWSPGGNVSMGVPGEVQGYQYQTSMQLRSNLTKGTSSGICSETIFGNWSELLIGEWGVMEIMVNPYDSTGFTMGDVLLRAFQTLDIGVRHAASFAVISDQLTTGF